MVSEAQKKASNKWNKNHPDVIKKSKKKYMDINKDRINAERRKSRKDNKYLLPAFLELANIHVSVFYFTYKPI